MVNGTAVRNRHALGPRTRAALRAVARVVNPVVTLIAGRRWMPILGILHHVGRRSGRAYATPLGMRPSGDSFVMARTFGEEAAWNRNVMAAGACQVTYRGRRYSLVEPELIDYATARTAFPRYERGLLWLIGINEYLRLRIAPVSSTSLSSEATDS